LGCIINFFTAVHNYVPHQARVFATLSDLHCNPIFTGLGNGGGSTRVGSSPDNKYETRVDVFESGKHSSLLTCKIDYGRKKF